MKLKQTLIPSLALLAVTVSCVAYSSPTMALECSLLPDSICNASNTGNLSDSGVWRLLIMGINILTAGIGIVAVGAIVYAGFLYASAQDNAQQTKKALEMIRNTAVGIVLYALMFALLNFLIPGGIFSTSGGRDTPPPSRPAPVPPGGPPRPV